MLFKTLGIVVGIFVLAVVVILTLFLIIRYKRRQQINLERGLSMIPLRIHLPPISDDVTSENKDSRTVVEENVSKASVLYNILTSTAEKQSFQTNYLGQSHFGFEIVLQAGQIYFYAIAPLQLVEVIKHAVSSTYKEAKIEEVDEYNIFSETATLENARGGELALKEHFAYPIATYVKTRQDIMKSLLGSLANLQESDGAVIQLLLRPADPRWIKTAEKIARNISEQKKSNNLAKDLLISAVKSPEETKDNKPKELSSLEKAKVEAIGEKISQPGFETLIRVLAVTHDAQLTENVYQNIIATFSLLDDPSSNGFKIVKTNDRQQFMNNFNLRLFPQSAKKNILNTTELATIFHIPDQANIPTSQLERQTSKQVDGPRNFSQEGLLLGYNIFRDQKRPIYLSDQDRQRHMYVVGQTGTGKSVFLENLILQDVQAGKGFAVVDPHGELADKIISQIPQERLDDVIYFNPANIDYPLGLNIFEADTVDQQDLLIQEAIAMLYKLYDPHHQGIMGPRYEHMFRNAAKLIMADPQGGSFIDIPQLFNDRSYVEQKLLHVTDKTVIDFWKKEILDASRSSEFGDMKSWFISKFSAFLSNSMMRNIIGQTKSSFDLRQIMDDGKIMIINLSFGRTGELNMKLLGMLFVTKFQMAAMSRADVSEDQRTNFTLYVDEFQNFATDSFENILSQARKYRLALVVANQYTSQLKEEIREAVFGNVGTAVSFRISASDAEALTKQFYSPAFKIDDLTALSLGHTVVRTLVDGSPTPPFNMTTLPPAIDYNQDQINQATEYVLKRHSRPRDEVETEIFKRLEVDPSKLPRSEFPPSKMPPRLNPALDKSPKPPAQNINNQQFIDGWLKRKQALQKQANRQGQLLDERLKQLHDLKRQAQHNPDNPPPPNFTKTSKEDLPKS